MHPIFWTILTTGFYVAACGVQVARWRLPALTSLKYGVLITAMIAIGMHAVLLHAWIDGPPDGQNLTFLNLLSTVVWLINVWVLIVALTEPIESLFLLLFPLTILLVGLVWIFPEKNLIHTGQDPKVLFHILFSLFTFSILCCAGLLAGMLGIEDCRLKRKQAGFVRILPSLEALEILLFKTITLGFIALSILLGTSFYFFSKAIWIDHLLQKTLFTCVAWIVFAILLTGRYFLGWRGKKAVYYTLVGVLLMVLAYLCSWMIGYFYDGT